MHWRERTDLPPVQREACEWLAEHGIDPARIPLHGVTVKRRKVIAQQCYEDDQGHRRCNPATNEALMDPPVKRRITRQPPQRVRDFLANPDPFLHQHHMAELADELMAVLSRGDAAVARVRDKFGHPQVPPPPCECKGDPERYVHDHAPCEACVEVADARDGVRT